MKTEKVEIEMPEKQLNDFIDLIDGEMEALKGERKVMPDGNICLKIELTGYKLEMVKDFCQMLMSLPTNKIKVKYKGQTIHPNSPLPPDIGEDLKERENLKL
jgi:hypothetical protein